MILSSPPFSFLFLLRRRARLGAVFGAALFLVIPPCDADSTAVKNFLPQGAMQGDFNAGGHSITNAAGVSSGSGVTSTTATPLVGYLGFDLGTQGMVLGASKGGRNFSAQFINYVPTDGGNSRDVSLLLDNSTQRPVRYNGLYWICHTSGIFGYINYIGIASSPDLINWSTVAQVPLVGTAVGSISTTATASSGSSTITLPGTALSGLANGGIYSVTGNSNLPANACIIYHSSATTQTLGLQNVVDGTLSGTIVTAGAVSGSIRLTYVSNSWSPAWYTDASGNVGILLRVSTIGSNPYGTPGIGYITCSNPGTFTSWSDFTVLSGVHSNANMGSILNQSGTWYLFTDEGNSARGGASDLSYYTASAPTGPYTYQGFMGIGAAYQTAFGTLTFVESNQPLYLGGTNWRVYFANQSTGSLYYTESTSGLTGGWSAPKAMSWPSINGGVGAGHPFFLSNSDDAFAIGQAVAPSPYDLTFSWNQSVTRSGIRSGHEYFSIGGPSSLFQFNPGAIYDFGAFGVSTSNANTFLYMINTRSGGGQNTFQFQNNGAERWDFGTDVGSGTFYDFFFYNAASGHLTLDLEPDDDAFFNGGNIVVETVGKGLQVKEGSNAKQGSATLSSGTVTVANTSVTANSRFVLTPHGSTINAVGVSAVVAGTSFTIKSASGSDANTIDYEIFEPAP